MAIVNLSLTSQDKCPEIWFEDTSNYAEQGVYVYSDIVLANGTVANNTCTIQSLLFSSGTIGTQDLFNGSSIYFATGANGYVVDYDLVYPYLAEVINRSDVGVTATVVGTTASTMKVRVAAPLTWAGAIPSVGYSGSPLFTINNMNLPSVAVDARSLSIIKPDGTYADLGAVAMKEVFTLTQPFYDVGSIFTFDFCGDTIEYTVTTDNLADCVLKGIMTALSTTTITNFNKYISYQKTGSSIVFTAKVAGVPFYLVPSYSIVSPTQYYSYTTETANVSSMSLPSFDSDDIYEYTPDSKGGKYYATLTVVSDCDYSEVTTELFNWCYDTTNFECCLLSFVKDNCCSSCSKKKRSASHINAIIKTLSIMIGANHSEHEIQKIVDLGWSICGECKECKGCK